MKRSKAHRNSVPAAWRIALWIALSGLAVRAPADPPAPGPAFTFAAVSDIQYADKDDAGTRHYRGSLPLLKECAEAVRKRHPDFLIQLGDMVDTGPETHLDAVLALLSAAEVPLYHVVGNHCLTLGREALLRRLGLTRAYYDFTRPGAPGWRFVVLDGNDGGYGAIGPAQLEWLKKVLAQAVRQNERVLCFCHFPLIKEAGDARISDARPVLEVLDAHPRVVAWFSGHYHSGGYAVRNGVHHLTLRGMVEASERNAYAFIELGPDGLRLQGVGDQPSRDLKWPVSDQP
jgi:3',5'-cyclic AMP phosphodiesterase CpdA